MHGFRPRPQFLWTRTTFEPPSRRMPQTRRHRRRQAGGGFQTSQQYFNPSVLPPATGLLSAAAPSSAPTSDMVRPPLYSTFQKGGLRSTRRMRGGFSPSVMGGFIPNAQAAIVPAALYAAYHTLVKKRGAAGLSKRASKLIKTLSGRKRRA